MHTLYDQEELEILDYLDNKETFQKPTQKEIDDYRKSALYTKAQQIKKQTTIRFNVADLTAIKAKAKEHGIGYQNLIQILVHNYAQGKIKLEL